MVYAVFMCHSLLSVTLTQKSCSTETTKLMVSCDVLFPGTKHLADIRKGAPSMGTPNASVVVENRQL